MSSPPTSSFRAEPFRNLTPKSLAPLVSPFNTVAASDTRRRAVPLVIDDIGVHHGQDHDELVDDDGEIENHNLPSESLRGGYREEPAGIRARFAPGGVNSRPSTFLPPSITPEISNMSSNASGDVSFVSDHQRSSISSTSSGSLPRRSSSGDGVSEIQSPVAGKGKRKSIPAVQSGMMNSFKIRPPTVWEATGGSQVASAPRGTYLSPPPPGSHYAGTNAHMVAGTGVPEDRLRDAIVQQEMTPSPVIVPRADRVVKPVRKRARREEPSDLDHQIFFQDDIAHTQVSNITRTSSSDLIQPQAQSPTPPFSQPPVASSPPPMADTITTIPTETINPPISITAAPIPSPPSIIAPDPLPVDHQVSLSSSTQPIATQTKSDIRLTLFDASDRSFTIPSPDTLDKNGPPPKRWTPVFREMATIGGGSWKAATWISQGEASVPAKPPVDFKPVPRSRPHGADIPMPGSSGITPVGSSSVGTTGSLLGTSINLTQKGLVSKGALDGSRTLAPSRKIKKAKSEGHMKGLGATTSLAAPTGGPLEGAASGASSPVLGSVPLTPIRGAGKKGTTTRKTKKSTAEPVNPGVEGADTPAAVEPLSLASGHADTDTEMKDA